MTATEDLVIRDARDADMDPSKRSTPIMCATAWPVRKNHHPTSST